ncbi:unnamed protein product [Rangifer tarandus platyrhynchus]|uniref:Uncharacterized protein n=1 Tax=Rangifer tarandus platyrhynchus TaxID=3082113 RepID=A0AC59YI40_RANTA
MQVEPRRVCPASGASPGIRSSELIRVVAPARPSFSSLVWTDRASVHSSVDLFRPLMSCLRGRGGVAPATRRLDHPERGLRARSRLSWVHTGHGIPSTGCACCLALRPPALAVFRGFLLLTAALVGVSCSLPWSNPGSTFTLSHLPGVHMPGSLSSGNALPRGHTCVAAADHWREPGPAPRAESALLAQGRVSSPPQTGALPGIHGAGRPGRQGPTSSPPAEQRTGYPRPWIRESTPPCRVVGTAPGSPQVDADGVLGPLTEGTPQPAPRRHRGPAHPGHRGETCQDRQPPGHHPPARRGGSSPGAPPVTQPRGSSPCGAHGLPSATPQRRGFILNGRRLLAGTGGHGGVGGWGPQWVGVGGYGGWGVDGG